MWNVQRVKFISTIKEVVNQRQQKYSNTEIRLPLNFMLADIKVSHPVDYYNNIYVTICYEKEMSTLWERW